jgi:hypothetical protein
MRQERLGQQNGIFSQVLTVRVRQQTKSDVGTLPCRHAVSIGFHTNLSYRLAFMGGDSSTAPQVKRSGDSANEFYSANKMMVHDHPRMYASTLNQIQRATCKVERPGCVGTGFLAKVGIPSTGDTLFGLITNNHVLPSDTLVPNSVINLRFEALQDNVTLTIRAGSFRFTDPFIDCTFVGIESGEQVGPLIQSNFLPISESHGIHQRVWVAQHMEGGELVVDNGDIRCRWGFDYLHEVNTECGASGSALCDCEGRVVGLHKARRPQDKCYVATGMHYVALALRNTLGSWRSTLPAKRLSQAEIQELKDHGLEPTGNPNVFISPASSGVTALWFYRANHAWYWTSKGPHTFDVQDLKQCSWSVIWHNEPDRAIGGYWDGVRPARRNRKLIAWLISTGLRFLQ